MNEYSFIRLSENRIKDLYQLFISSSKQNASYKKFLAKFDTKYTGVEYVGYFAYDRENKPVAFYGVVPCFAIAGDRKILIAQAVDAITHPDHRRKGLFEKIVALTTELALKEGIHFIYGVPNDLSYQGFIKKFNWSEGMRLLKFQFKISQLPFSYFFQRYALLNRLYFSYLMLVFGLFRKGSIFMDPDSDGTNIRMLRNEEYLQYKSYSRKFLIRLNHLSIWLSVDGALKIGDIQPSDQPDNRHLIRKLKFLAFFAGTRKIVYMATPNSFWAQQLQSKYKSEFTLPSIFLNLSNLYDPEKLIISYCDIDTF